MFHYDAVHPDDDATGGLEASPYEIACQKYFEEQELARQVKRHGEDALRGGQAAKTDSGAVRALQMQPKGHTPTRASYKDPLRDLMTQLEMKPGVDIETVALPDSKGKVPKLGNYDRRAIAPLKNPQKRWALPVPEGAHGMVQRPGSCTGHIGSTSSGKTTSMCHQLAVNHATWRYDHVWLLHPDSDAALAGEYALCKGDGVGMKALPHFPTMEWLAENSAGFSMLDAACFSGNAHAVPLLVAAGVDPLKAGRDGNGPFARATWGKRDEHAATVAAFLAAVPSLKVAETFTVKGTPGKKDEVKVPEPVYLACENDATKKILGARVAEQSVAARRGPLAAPPGSTFSVEAYDYDAAKSQTTITFAVAGPQGEARDPLTVTLATTPEGGTAPLEHPEL